MKFDKKNGNVAFVDKTHEYFDVTDPNKKYISVTTLIHKYTRPFDSDFWSKYKALERLIPKDSWQIEKKSLLSSKKFDKEILKIYNISENKFNQEQQNILDEWQKKNIESCRRGTKIHSMLENALYKAEKNVSLKKFGIGGKFECRKDYYELDLENGAYPEYLIYLEDGDFRLAGQVDLIVKQGNNITIADYKTNQKIDQKGGFDTVSKSTAKMLYPLNNLEDANFYHYTMQLSTYAYMLQKINPNFIIKDLILYHFDHNNKETMYHCDYLKDEVERMFSHYKKNMSLEQKRSKRKRIEY